jgi:hypothetical protein
MIIFPFVGSISFGLTKAVPIAKYSLSSSLNLRLIAEAIASFLSSLYSVTTNDLKIKSVYIHAFVHQTISQNKLHLLNLH